MTLKITLVSTLYPTSTSTWFTVFAVTTSGYSGAGEGPIIEVKAATPVAAWKRPGGDADIGLAG
jgi:hypothetical protein